MFYGFILVHLHIDIRIRTYVLYSYIVLFNLYTVYMCLFSLGVSCYFSWFSNSIKAHSDVLTTHVRVILHKKSGYARGMRCLYCCIPYHPCMVYLPTFG